MNLVIKNERQDHERGAAHYKFIDMINIDQLHDFTVEMLNQHGTQENLEEANQVADVLIQLLKKKGLMDGQTHQSFIDVLLTSTMLHNLFTDKEDWTSLYNARYIMEPVAREEFKINKQVTDAIFQTIEAQLGDESPVPASRPQPNTPTELFAYCVWFIKEYQPQV